jgi:hypothetical protein
MPNAINLDLLTKLLRLTTSECDGEALTAIRKANAHLTTVKATWDDFIAARKASLPPPPDDDDDDADWGEVIEKILKRKIPDHTRAFFESVLSYWDNNGFLSEKQVAVVRKYQR